MMKTYVDGVSTLGDSDRVLARFVERGTYLAGLVGQVLLCECRIGDPNALREEALCGAHDGRVTEIKARERETTLVDA